MNHFHAKAEYSDGAWRALVRYSHKAEYWPIMDGHRPAGFPTREAAEIAVPARQEACGRREAEGAGVSLDLDLFGNDTMQRDATFRGDDRLTLTRAWGLGPKACFIGCNPSRAGKKLDDPTCLWWTRWSKLFGYGRYTAVNMYPFVTSSPAECRKMADWESNGPDWYARDAIMHNLDVVTREAKSASIVIACWGAIAWDDDWIEHVVESIQSGDEPWPDLYCFGTTSSGAPKHPMARGLHRIPQDQKPILWRAA